MNDDMSKCANKKCPSAKMCDRFTYKSRSKYQTYSDFEPDGEGQCEYFIENSNCQGCGHAKFIHKMGSDVCKKCGVLR